VAYSCSYVDLIAATIPYLHLLPLVEKQRTVEYFPFLAHRAALLGLPGQQLREILVEPEKGYHLSRLEV
jgi:hypothetical protein